MLLLWGLGLEHLPLRIEISLSPANEDQSAANFSLGIRHCWWKVPDIYWVTGLQTICKALRRRPWAQAKRPFTISALLSCIRSRKPSLPTKGIRTLKNWATSVILNSAYVCVYISRKCVRKWLTRKTDIWVKCSLHLVNHMEVSEELCVLSLTEESVLFKSDTLISNVRTRVPVWPAKSTIYPVIYASCCQFIFYALT